MTIRHRLFLVVLFTPLIGVAQVDVGYSNMAVGSSPHFGMDSPDQQRTPLHLSLGTSYQERPLIFETVDGADIIAIDERLLSTLSASVHLYAGFHVLLQGKLLAYQSGSGAGPSLPLAASPILGRTRIGLKYSGQFSGGPTSWAFQSILALPSELEDPLFGGPGYQPTFALLLGHHHGQTKFGFNAAFQHRPSRSLDQITEEPRVNLDFGVNHLINEDVGVLVESYWSRQLSNQPEDSMRLDGGLAFNFTESVRSKLGGGLGVLRGIGTPRIHLFLGLEYVMAEGIKRAPSIRSRLPENLEMASPSVTLSSKKDSDRDGLPDRDDACPLLAEDRDNFLDNDGCPDPDNDHDGYADHEDSAPNMPEDYDGFQDHDGAPEADNDSDGLSDGVDRCPRNPGVGDGCPESTFDWRDYVARSSRTVPSLLHIEDVLYVSSPIANSIKESVLDETVEWLNENRDWTRMNIIVSYCAEGSAKQEAEAVALAKNVSIGLREFGISENRIGYFAKSRYRIPADDCGLYVQIKKLKTFEGLGERLDDDANLSAGAAIEILPVRFLPGRSSPSADTAPVLINFADRMKKLGDYFELQVHTDALGDQQQKLDLSQQRALELEELLQFLGLAPSQFRCIGKGGDEPIGDNQTIEGRRSNNRVQVLIMNDSEAQR